MILFYPKSFTLYEIEFFLHTRSYDGTGFFLEKCVNTYNNAWDDDDYDDGVGDDDDDKKGSKKWNKPFKNGNRYKVFLPPPPHNIHIYMKISFAI